MNLTPRDIQKSDLYPLVLLEKVLPSGHRQSLYVWAATGSVTLFIIAALIRTAPLTAKLAGAALIFFAGSGAAFLLELFFRSLYFRAKGKAFTEGSEQIWSLEVLKVVENARGDDLVWAFLTSPAGTLTMRRLGVPEDGVRTFLSGRGRLPVVIDSATSPERWYTLGAFAKALVSIDTSLRDMLLRYAIDDSLFAGAANWYAIERSRELDARVWWTYEHLSSIRGLGSDWNYGKTFALNTYATQVHAEEANDESSRETLERLVGTLTKAKESNALIVGPSGNNGILEQFQGYISAGDIPENLRGKRIMRLDSDLLIAKTGTKQAFEVAFRALLEEAGAAGNVIIAIERFAAFIASTRTIGVDISSILDPFLADTRLPIIAVADIRSYHRELEPTPAIIRRFDVLTVKDPEMHALVSALTREATALERRNGVFFTYPAVVEAADAAEHYFSGNLPLDTATDLLAEASARAVRNSSGIIGKDLILALVSEKTDIPTGEITNEERDMLTNLEGSLHRRVIGQEQAIVSIANALRRSRAGVRNREKPIGSFMFFGPTGVGKTETAKALSEIMFHNENALMRIDMSEYQTGDALARLIGFSGGEAGILATMLREKPYGVLLLDEFEKTNPDVHDLFLQILDEGFFTDARGERVNARNILFIATSNAGSNLIWKATEEGKDLSQEHDAFVQSIISSGTFKPELLNRFTDLILFHPLTPDDLKSIARIMLNSLVKRLREERGLLITVSDDMITYVAKEGYDPGFGARPMKRFIEDHVEQYIADGIIKGTISPGATITLTPTMLTPTQLETPDTSPAPTT
ncbi:MAG: ATP-dependent Clp protease ATP-binding subunit [Candidatus Yonathbacteria bacterium]|nr:ATP-dependent Clp protease ATP-binding subunit [Candidatus Yonathbacteria bacterium]